MGYAPGVSPLLRELAFDGPVAVVGDIHGRLDLLDPLLEQLGDMPLLVCGDLGDRGPDARGVIERLIERGAQGVMGNHEEWLLAWIHGHGFDPFVLNPQFGAEPTLASYGVEGRAREQVEEQCWRVPDSHRAFLDSLAVLVDLEVQGERYWLCHGGVPSWRSYKGLEARQVLPWLLDNHPRDILWAGTEPEAMVPLDRPILMGHMAIPEPLDLGYVIALDTGAGTFGPHGTLTAVVLPDRRFVSAGPVETPPWIDPWGEEHP